LYQNLSAHAQNLNNSNLHHVLAALREIVELVLWNEALQSSPSSHGKGRPTALSTLASINGQASPGSNPSPSQNFFDFFLEHQIPNYLIHLLCYVEWADGVRGHVQKELLQTLSILFENLKGETSVYVLLSKGWVGDVVECGRKSLPTFKGEQTDGPIDNQSGGGSSLDQGTTNKKPTILFDFTDEEVLAYYITFLKALSLRLNENTIYFFYFPTASLRSWRSPIDIY
jgi:protein CLEC16A